MFISVGFFQDMRLMGPVDKKQLNVYILFILVINVFISFVFHMCHMGPFYLIVRLLLFPFPFYLQIMQFITRFTNLLSSFIGFALTNKNQDWRTDGRVGILRSYDSAFYAQFLTDLSLKFCIIFHFVLVNVDFTIPIKIYAIKNCYKIPHNKH